MRFLFRIILLGFFILFGSNIAQAEELTRDLYMEKCTTTGQSNALCSCAFTEQAEEEKIKVREYLEKKITDYAANANHLKQNMVGKDLISAGELDGVCHQIRPLLDEQMALMALFSSGGFAKLPDGVRNEKRKRMMNVMPEINEKIKTNLSPQASQRADLPNAVSVYCSSFKTHEDSVEELRTLDQNYVPNFSKVRSADDLAAGYPDCAF